MARKPKPPLPEPPLEGPENVAARQRGYKARRKDRGEVRVSVWVPADKAKKLRDIATMWRRKAELADGLTSPTPPVRVPRVEIPDLPSPGYAWIKSKVDEVLMHKILRANGAEWVSKKQLWRIRSDLVEPLGLKKRVVRRSKSRVLKD